jgi:GT2 family glycosyltransferase
MVNHLEKVVLGSDVTVAMAAYGNYKTTKLAIDALFFSTEGNFELILVNDCSPDNTLSLFLEAKEKHLKTKIISFDKNLEYSGSLNAILSHATGEWILFISNDIFITPGYLREIFRIARSKVDFGIIRGVSNSVDNGLTTHNIMTPENIDNFEKLFKFAELTALEFSGQYLVDQYLTGDAFLISRRVLDKIGTLDPRFYGYFADSDLGIRTRIAGYNIILARGAFAFHLRHSNFEYLPEELREEKIALRLIRMYENWARFKMKYEMPVELTYTNINDIPWDKLSTVEFNAARHYCPPKDYKRYIL